MNEANVTPAELGIPEVGPYLFDIFEAAGRADAVALACTLAGSAHIDASELRLDSLAGRGSNQVR